MSGPKTSSYSADYETLRKLQEQQRIEREKREEERKVRYETEVFRNNKNKINELSELINNALTVVQSLADKTGKKYEIVEKEKEKSAELMQSVKNAGSLENKNSKTLHNKNAELSVIIQELLALYKNIVKFSDEIYGEYYQKLDVVIERGYFLSYSTEVINEIKSRKLLKNELEEMEMIIYHFDPDGLPDDFLTRYRDLLDETAEIKDAKKLRKFVLTMIKPFIEECAEYKRLLAEFEAGCVTYYALADIYETDPINFEPYKKNTVELKKGSALLKKQIEILEKADLREREIGYIYAALDEAMTELGYSLCASSERMKKARVVHHQLYSMHDDTYLDVHFSDDGQISMQIGKGENTDRIPTDEEAAEQAAKMINFCGDYERLETMLEAKGIKSTRVIMIPPSANCAEIINISDFGLTISEPQEKKKTRDEKAKQHTRDIKQRRHNKEKLKEMARPVD